MAAAAAGIALGGIAHAESNEELKARLDQALKTIQDLQNRVNALEQGKAPAPAPAPAAPAAAAPAAAPVPAVVVAPNSRPEEGAPDAGSAHVEIYGQAMLDTIYDFKRMNPDWAATLRPSQIPISCPGDPGCGKNGNFIFSARQSSLGVRGFIPTSIGLVKTDLSFDLFGTGGGGTQAHWLHAWGEVGMFGAGQIESNFMDLDAFPNTIDYWGPPGMVFVRNPQLRITPYSKDGVTWAFSLEAPNSAIDTGKLTEVDPSLGAAVAPWNRLPDLVGSVRFDGDWGHVKAAALLRQVGAQNTGAADGNPAVHRTGYGINLAGALKFTKRDTLSWQLAYGEAMASYMNDGGIDLAPDANLHAQTVKSLGWFAWLGHGWNDKWSSSIGFSQHTQDNADGQFDNAFHRGSYGSINLLYTPARNILTGAEYIWGKNEAKDGSSAIDDRIQFSTKFQF
jgi:hypothetical protein